MTKTQHWSPPEHNGCVEQHVKWPGINFKGAELSLGGSKGYGKPSRSTAGFSLFSCTSLGLTLYCCKYFWFTLVWGRRLKHYLQVFYMAKIQMGFVWEPLDNLSSCLGSRSHPRTSVRLPTPHWHWQKGQRLLWPPLTPTHPVHCAAWWRGLRAARACSLIGPILPLNSTTSNKGALVMKPILTGLLWL